MTLKSKNNIAYFTTLIGNKSLTSGVHNWSVSVDQISGAFVCFGILPVQMNINYKTNYYTQAYCVCSDKYVYNMVKFAGEITNGINSGDILECVLNFEEDFFKIKNGDSFEYTAKNVKGKEFYPYFGFSAFNATQLSLLF